MGAPGRLHGPLSRMRVPHVPGLLQARHFPRTGVLMPAAKFARGQRVRVFGYGPGIVVGLLYPGVSHRPTPVWQYVVRLDRPAVFAAGRGTPALRFDESSLTAVETP